MGSLSSRPKAVASVSTGSAPTHAATTDMSQNTNTNTNTPAAPDTVTNTKTRVENILRRSRGIMGNIATSFRGVLSSRRTPQTPSRKSLLGE